MSNSFAIINRYWINFDTKNEDLKIDTNKEVHVEIGFKQIREEKEVQKILECLPRETEILSLGISIITSSFDPPCLEEFLSSVVNPSRFPQLRVLRFSFFKKDDATKLVKFLSKYIEMHQNQLLTGISFLGCQLDFSSLDVFATLNHLFLNLTPSLQSIELENHNNWDDRTRRDSFGMFVHNILMKKRCLFKLNLARNSLADVDMAQILLPLSIPSNENMREIARVQVLDLSHYEDDGSVWHALGEVLKYKTSLTELKIRQWTRSTTKSARNAEKSITHFLRMLCTENKTLEKLDLSGNRALNYHGRASEWLAIAINGHPSLTHLNIENMGFSIEDESRIFSTLARKPSNLTHLTMGSSMLKIDDLMDYICPILANYYSYNNLKYWNIHGGLSMHNEVMNIRLMKSMLSQNPRQVLYFRHSVHHWPLDLSDFIEARNRNIQCADELRNNNKDQQWMIPDLCNIVEEYLVGTKEDD